MSRIDSRSLSTLLDQALSGNLLNLADVLHRFHTQPALELQSNKYPPSNVISLTDNSWMLEFAVAGFSRDELSVTLEEGNVLCVAGNLHKEPQNDGRTYLRRGIGLRSFVERFSLADNTRVGNIKLLDGMLRIMIERDTPKLPEPKTLQIN